MKKKKTAADIQQELRGLTKGEAPPSFDQRKVYVRVGLVALALWAIAVILPGWIPKAVAGVITVVAGIALVWLRRYISRQQALGLLVRGAETQEGRKQALEQIDAQFKKGNSQALLAKAQLQMQDDPRSALATLESIALEKELAPVASQVRGMRAMIHLNLGEAPKARELADKLDLGKQQESTTRVMLAAVAAESWARTGLGKKAVDTLDLFDADDPKLGELRVQIWRARAFAYASTNDLQGLRRAVKKLAEINPHLLAMFVGQKRIHPLLEREAKQLAMKAGLMAQKVVRQRM